MSKRSVLNEVRWHFKIRENLWIFGIFKIHKNRILNLWCTACWRISTMLYDAFHRQECMCHNAVTLSISLTCHCWCIVVQCGGWQCTDHVPLKCCVIGCNNFASWIIMCVYGIMLMRLQVLSKSWRASRYFILFLCSAKMAKLLHDTSARIPFHFISKEQAA